MLKCASTEWSCWYYPKPKDTAETWPLCTAVHGQDTENTGEKWKDSQSQGGQLALKTKATACCELEVPLHAAPRCAPPLKPKQQEVRTAGVHISVLHVLVIGKNFHETSRLHARVYTWTDTAGKGLRMVPLSWWYKQFSHDSALSPSPQSCISLTYSTPSTLGGKHLPQMRGLAGKKMLWHIFLLINGFTPETRDGKLGTQSEVILLPRLTWINRAHWGGTAEVAAHGYLRWSFWELLCLKWDIQFSWCTPGIFLCVCRFVFD